MNVKAKRTKLKLSQMALAVSSGVGRYNISLAETGLRTLTKSEKDKLNLAFRKAEKKSGSTSQKSKSK